MEATNALLLTLGAAALLASWVLLLIESSREDFALGTVQPVITTPVLPVGPVSPGQGR